MNVSKSVKILIGFLTAFAVLFPFVIMPAFAPRMSARQGKLPRQPYFACCLLPASLS